MVWSFPSWSFVAWDAPSIHRRGRRCFARLRQLAGLGAVVDGAEEGVGQRDRRDVAHLWIAGERRVDEEGDRHVDGLPGRERLLVEAEALDLGEIEPDLVGRNVEGRLALDRPAGQVLGAEI